MKYLNLFEFINSKAKEGKIPGDDNKTVSEQEFRECLMTLENDGVINCFGHKMAPIIRFTNTD